MAFNSFAFALFLPTVLGLYWLLSRRPSAQNRLLLAGSYFFYGFWDWRFLSLILISTVVDYFVALRVHAIREQAGGLATTLAKRWLTLSIVTNLGILGFFKYFNFFADSFAHAVSYVGIQANPFYLNIVLPVGISFYTFQTLSYTVDVYRGEMKPTRRFLDFALYVAFFPQLVAGPIERAKRLLPQILGERRFDKAQFADGIQLIFWGLFKKVYVADNLAPFVDRVFASPDPTGFEVIFAGYAFAFQIYCDFSGYTDIARGCAKCLGMELMVNFRYPYVAVNPSDFWRRWHISLSTWLRDYLYISLGGNRAGTIMTYRNLSLTMLLGGLWHGATWLFVLWGAYQGLLLVVHRALAPRMEAIGKGIRAPERVVRVVKVLVMFQLICVGWLIFRGESVGQISGMVRALFSWAGDVDWTVAVPLAQFALPLLVLEALLGLSRTDSLHRVNWIPVPVRTAIYAGLFYLLAFHGAVAQTFIYFQF
jgi:alginate O-acetyltransferase complex protein AlgI